MSKIETVKVTLDVPKAIMQFLREFEADPQQYLIESIVDSVEADLDEIGEKVAEKYGLKRVFKAFYDE